MTPIAETAHLGKQRVHRVKPDTGKIPAAAMHAHVSQQSITTNYTFIVLTNHI